MNGLAEEFEGQATIVQLNAAIPANERLQQNYGVRGHPSAVILDSEGRVTQRYFGVVTAVTLRSALGKPQKLFGNNEAFELRFP